VVAVSLKNFLPVYLDGLIPPELACGGESPDPESAWWTFKALQDVASGDPVRLTPRVREAFAPLEEQLEAARADAETRAAAANPDARAAVLTQFMAHWVREALDLARQLRERIA
jgi:dipeptidase